MINDAPLPTIRRRRGIRARIAAKRLGVSERTIYRYQSEFRNDYEARAAERRMTAHQLRTLGQSWAEVGQAMGITAEAARLLAYRYRQQTVRLPVSAGDPNTLDMFRGARA